MCGCIRETPVKIIPHYDLQVIIPIYNTHRYLKRCILSIISQKTKYKWYIVLVNDGSTDESGLICDDFASRYEHIVTIHKNNGGVSSARNAGMTSLVSKYVMFIDSDDWLLPGAIESLINMAEANNADIVQSQYRQSRLGLLSLRRYGSKSVGKISSDALLGFVWGKIYRSELFSKVCFPEGLIFEDTINRFLIFPQAKRCYSTGVAGYVYRSNFNSITHKLKQSNNITDTVTVTKEVLRAHDLLGFPKDESFYKTLRNQREINNERLLCLKAKARDEAISNNDSVFKKLFKFY